MTLDLQINDILHIVFNDHPKTKQEIIYAYKFKKNKWVEDEYDWFELENRNHKKVAEGSIDKL
jgi:hypothetical protein